MKNLRKLGTAIVLTFVLGPFAFAGERVASACGSPEPGQVDTPPCAMAQAPIPGDMGTPTKLAAVPGQVETPPDSASLTGIAANVLQLMLSFF